MKTNQETRPMAQDARERLLEAATGLFAEKGYALTTVQEIVRRAGVTKPVLYYYFRSKAGIFTAILDGAAKLQEDMLESVRGAPGSTLDRLLLLYSIVYDGISSHPSLLQLIHNLLFGPPKGVPPYDYARFHGRMIEAVQSIYREGVSRGEVVDAEPEEVALLVLGLMDFCFHREQIRHVIPDPCRSERLLRLAFQGLVRRPDEEKASELQGRGLVEGRRVPGGMTGGSRGA